MCDLKLHAAITRPPVNDVLRMDGRKTMATDMRHHLSLVQCCRNAVFEFKIKTADYIKRLYNGHYTPAGNQFFAFAIKPAVVEWLNPKPPAYQGSGTIIDFQDGRYLEKITDEPKARKP